MAQAGSSILKEIVANPTKRDDIIKAAFEARDMPSWMFQWRPIRVEAVIDGKSYVLEYFVSPDYLSLGTDDDFFRVPLTPMLAQEFADDEEAILPSRRMVNEIYANANGKLIPQPIAGNDASLSDWAKHEILMQQQQKALGLPGGTFLAGHMKDIVIGPNLDGSKVAIYGWHDESGQNTQGKANAPIQPYSTIHGAYYMDYAHGTRLVKKRAILNGAPADLNDLFTDPKLSVLVSDQGAFKPRYPFGGAVAAFARTVAGPSETSKLVAQATTAYERGDNISAAQATLAALGHDPGPIDGVLGPKTVKAITAFQQSEGLPANGQLDSATLQKLRDKSLSTGRIETAKKVGKVAVGGAFILGLGFLAKKALFS